MGERHRKTSEHRTFIPFDQLPPEEQEKYKRLWNPEGSFKSPEGVYVALMHIKVSNEQSEQYGRVGGFPSQADQAANYIKYNNH